MPRLLAFVLAFSTLPLHAAPESDSITAASEMLASIYTNETPGAVAVVSRDGEVLLNAAVGMADLELDVAMQPDHVLRLASVTKQYAAAAMLALVEEGRVSLDDPISKFLPDYPVGEVTVRQLLNHTSGIRSYTSIPDYMTSERIRKHLTTDELVAVFADEPVDFAPGERWSYNNSGYVLVGAILEAVTGKPWNAFLRERLLEPAGIESTDAYPDAEIVAGRVPGYSGPAEDPENAEYLSMTQPHAAGALMSTALDVDRWQRALHGGEILGEAMYRAMITPVDAAASENDGPDYGFGIGVGEWFGHPVMRHGGGIHGFTTYALWLPEEQLSVVVLTNRAGPGWSAEDVALRLTGLATGRPYAVDQDPIDLSEEELAEFHGTYRIDEETVRTIRYEDGALISQRAGGTEFRLVPVEGDRLAFERSVSWFGVERGEDGSVRAVALHQGWGGEPERAEKISEEVVSREPVEVPVDQLERLVGRYELMPNFILDVRVADGGLEIQATGQPAVEMLAESPVKFYNTDIGAEIVFELPETGPASSLTLYQGGQQMPAPRVETEDGEE